MPISYQIVPKYGLVYVRYHGRANFEDTMAAFSQYAQDPEYRPGQKQIVDFSAVTSWDEDYVELMKTQALKADAFASSQTQVLIVYYAPTKIGQKIAQLALQSWEPFPFVVPIVQDTEKEALAILGLPHDAMESMLASVT